MTDGLPPLREVIAHHGLAANKALGQHFLLDLNLTRKIAKAAGVEPGDTVLEIGPGPGGLTRALLEAGAIVTAIERDARCLPLLAEIADAYPGRLTVIEADALCVEERGLFPAPVKIVANLPYNIGTELLLKWLHANQRAPALLWTRMALMFQREVADRILAPAGGDAYGRLSVIAQAAARPSRAFDLPARAFTPPPKVDSSVVVFDRGPMLPDLAALESVTRAAFSQRRKMLRSAMKGLWGAQTEAKLIASGVTPSQRAEEINVPTFLAMADTHRARA